MDIKALLARERQRIVGEWIVQKTPVGTAKQLYACYHIDRTGPRMHFRTFQKALVDCLQAGLLRYRVTGGVYSSAGSR